MRKIFRFVRIDRVEVNGAAARGVQPIRAAVVPDEISRQRADGIEVAFEIGEGIFPRAVVQAFFAGFAGRADGEHARFNGFESVQAIVTADFEEPRAALAMVTIPVERSTLASSESGFESRAGTTPSGRNNASRSSATWGIVNISR